MLSDHPNRIAAGLTVFRPDRVIFDPLLDLMRAEADRVFVVIDGPVGEAIEPEHLREIETLSGVSVLALQENAGIAQGLNRLVKAARQAGFTRLVLFDQDSEPSEGLLKRLDEGLTCLAAAGHQPAAIGPRPVAAVGSGTRAPHYRRRRGRDGQRTSVDFVIISGCLLDLSAFESIGPFRTDLRMDGVDLEWGFRAWARGRSIWVDEAASLPHRVGTGLVRLGPIAFPRQSQVRMENYVRSQAMLLRMNHVPARWKMRSLFYLPLQILAYSLQGGEPLTSSRRLVTAARHGLAARSSGVPLP